MQDHLQRFAAVMGLAFISTSAVAQPATPTPDTPAAEATDRAEVRLSLATEIGYRDAHGRYVIDLMQDDYAYLAVRVTNAGGQPVEGVEPELTLDGTSQLLKPQDLASPPITNQEGLLEFAVLAGPMSLDRLTIQHGEARLDILINVIDARATTFLDLVRQGEDYLAWSDLMQARTRYENGRAHNSFPAVIAEQAGQIVKISGFITPLEPRRRQRHVLLTSHPPGCFHEAPGGPSGIVEVFLSEETDVSTWAAYTLEGRLETVEDGSGTVYRLHEARTLD